MLASLIAFKSFVMIWCHKACTVYCHILDFHSLECLSSSKAWFLVMPFLQKQDKKAWPLAKNMWFLSIRLTWNQHVKIKNVSFPHHFHDTKRQMGQVSFWYDLRHDKIWEIQSTWMSLGQGLLSFCCFLRFSDVFMAHGLPTFTLFLDVFCLDSLNA